MHKACAYRVALPSKEITVERNRNPEPDHVALTDQTRVVARSRFMKKVGRLSQKGIDAVELGLTYVLDL
jgi:mRNA-degrading endonuclease toxin of MazEF toxin-antitoxin module